MTRRMLLLGAMPLVAGDFWHEKRYSRWDEAEVERMLTDSPWAQRTGAVTVRWASAVPIQMAVARRNQGGLSVPESAREMKSYVISVEGLPAAERMALIDAATLKPGRKFGIPPEDVKIRNGIADFWFPKDDPIAVTDREAVFSVRVGRLRVRSRFALAKMMFDGKLAL